MGGKKRKTEEKGGEGNTEVKSLVKHILSKEQQAYFEKVADAVRGKSEKLLHVALQSLREDAGINELLPYFTQFIADQVTHNLLSLPLLFNLLHMSQSLLDSKHLNLEPYVSYPPHKNFVSSTN